MLLLHANEVVSRDRLIETLWDEQPPETAPKALQVYISRLRKALGKERLETKVPGYRLRVAEGEFDLERFQFLAENEPREALALWRGPPLAEFAYHRFAQSEIARLEELRLTCLERRLEEDLEGGQHAAVVGELEWLVHEHALRERLRGQLMLALYRSGRQAEALDVYQAGRRLLADELGLEPGESLKQLQLAILAHDPALALAQERGVEVAEPADMSDAAPAAVPPVFEQLPREMRKTVTVLSCDLIPTTSALDPEMLRRMTTRVFDELLPVLTTHGATIELSLGRGVTALFGVPAVHEDDPLRAARAAVEMRERLEGMTAELQAHWGASLELRIGIGTGEVVTGGDGERPLAAGEPVDSALRLRQLAQPGQLLMDNRTYRVIRDSVRADRTGESVTLHSIEPLPSAARNRFESPLVGREREMRRLHDAFEQALRDSSCQLFTLLGAAGVGKSRLVQEFVGDLVGRALVARGRCLPYGEGITYWPVMEAVKDATDLDDTDSPEESRRKLMAVLEDQQETELAAQLVAETIGLAQATGSSEEGFWAIRTFFESLARQQPLVLVFDDIHWGAATFLDLIDHISDWTRDAPLLLVCVARPDLLDVRPDWGGGKLNATSALLEPLTRAECVQLVGNLDAARSLDDRARSQVIQAAEGNPLFVEELLAFVLERGVDEDLEVPPTIQALLAARLDQLDDAERSTIEAASVEGKVFHEGSVGEHVLGPERTDVHRRLMSLLRKDLIRPDRPIFSGERAFRFRHLLIRDAAYESIPKEARAAYHERHALWLERAAAERLTEYEEIVGYHLEQAFRYRAEFGPVSDADRAVARRAAERLGAAGRRAFVRADAPAAVNLLSRAVSLLPPDDPARIGLVPSVRVAQGLGGDLGWAVRVLDAAIAAGDDRLRAHALVQRGLLRLFTGPDVTASELIPIAEPAIRTFEALGDDLGLARAWRLVAQANYLAKRAGSSVEAAERALVHARRADDPFEEREIVQYLLVALVLGPASAQEAARRCEQLLEEAAGDAVLEGDALGALAYHVAIQGHTARATKLLAESRRVIEAHGSWTLLPSYGVYFTVPALWESDPIAVERELRPVYETLTRIGGAKSPLSSLAVLLAQAVYAQGRYDEAEDLALEARAASRPIDVQSETIWRTVAAKVLAQRSQHERALQLAREALTFVEQSDFVPVHAEALVDLAEVLHLAGRPEEAAPALEDAARLFELKGNVVSASRARVLLEELQTS
jgi:DNA-binding SARP family transcriptional activator/tetratricopeptide (TPR) repeat protein